MKEETICQHLKEDKLANGHVQAINFSIFPIKYAKSCIFWISDYEHDLADCMHDKMIESIMEALCHIAHLSRPSVGVGDLRTEYEISAAGFRVSGTLGGRSASQQSLEQDKLQLQRVMSAIGAELCRVRQ